MPTQDEIITVNGIEDPTIGIGPNVVALRQADHGLLRSRCLEDLSNRCLLGLIRPEQRREVFVPDTHVLEIG
jgi:hypothetical protein